MDYDSRGAGEAVLNAMQPEIVIGKEWLRLRRRTGEPGPHQVVREEVIAGDAVKRFSKTCYPRWLRCERLHPVADRFINKYIRIMAVLTARTRTAANGEIWFA